jgi:hypothetical protein
MALKIKYDCGMRRLALSSFVLAAFLTAVQSAPSAHAQVVNWGPSVTSMGFGGNNRIGGFAPSVTSVGFGRTGGQESSHHGFFTQASPFVTNVESRHHRPSHSVWGGYYAYPVYIDSQDAYQTVPEPVENPDEYKGGPTIFDRRGDGQYATRRSEPVDEPLEAKALPVQQPPAEVLSQPQTILIFKDGHQANVDNYAIVGSTLYDLTGGKRHKIALADLDVTATAQKNDDRGVDFELPASSTTN